MKQFIELTKLNTNTGGDRTAVNIQNITYLKSISTGTRICFAKENFINVTESYEYVKELIEF